MIDEKKLIEDLLYNDGIKFTIKLHDFTPEGVGTFLDEFIDKMKQGIVNLINAQPKVGGVGGWIPVSERLPEYFGTFLVAIDEVHGENRVSVDAADFDPYEKSWKTFGYFCAGFKVTHWMPMPEPPKAGER